MKEFQFKLFSYTVEVSIHNSKYSHKFAKELLQKAYHNSAYVNVPKIALIKVLREIQPELGLKEAKEAVEEMFEFDSPAGLPRFKK